MRFARSIQLLFLLILAACGEHSQGTSQMAHPQALEAVSIKIGEDGADFSRRYAGHVHLVHQPAGIDFYSIDWDTPPFPSVTVEAGKMSFTVANVIGVQGQQDLDEKGEGLSEFSVYARVAPTEPISHDQARTTIEAILRGISNAGWQSFIDPGAPRLSGKERLNYALAHNKYIGLDPSYSMTLDEWMQLESRTPWFFHADGSFLEVSFQREASLTRTDRPGAYLLTLTLKSEAEYFRGFLESDQRPHWKADLPKVLHKLSLARAKDETELKAVGKAIDDRYLDPIPAIAASATQ